MDKFLEDWAGIEDPSNINFYLDTFRNLMDGNALIGSLAVNSSCHYKFQFVNNGEGIDIAPEFQFKIKLPGMNTFATVDKVDTVKSPFTKNLIGRICAEFQAASPDNGKDPCLGDLGLNGNTVSRVSFLIRIGLDPRTIGKLNRSQDLRDFAKELDVKIDKSDIKNYVMDIDEITNIMIKVRLGETLN